MTSNTLAFLQYTSGSTAQPRGVMLNHGHLLHNEQMIQQAFQQTERSIIVGWLPLYHDMGLIGNVLQPLYAGARCILMSPAHFLQSPVRWLQAISRYKATTSGGPNFAYDLCTRKITSEQRAQLDLSSWTVAFNGSEPVHPDTLDRFIAAFGPCGFRPEAFFPCYGLAEATLFVSGSLKSAPPVIHNIDGTALEHNRIVPVSAQKKDAVRVVACGRSWLDQQILIVDPESSKSCEPDAVGEIWLSGPSIAQGYWNRAEDSECTFGAYLADSGKGPYLRTGDLGFISDGQLFITGRLKDLIIIRGRNHYPQDIEQTVQQSHTRLRPGCGAAFSIDVCGEERLVVVQEVDRHCQHQEVEEIIATINQAVTAEHELTVYAVALIRPGTLPKTSSGKLQRHACRANFLNSNLDLVGEWRASISSQNDFAEFVSPTPERSAVAIEHWLRSQLAARLGEVESQIDINQSIANYGVDSLMAMEMIHSLEVNLNLI
jgi:acyl-CoA synthetase (AMP-forming)/AMP-acid ligase II